MPQYFVHYWTNDTWQLHREREETDPERNLNHTAGNLFKERGVNIGDMVYVVTVLDGKLFLGGRMEVEQILTQKEVNKYFGEKVWPAAEHLISEENTTLLHLDLEVPLNITKSLQFETKEGSKPLCFDGKRLDKQTLRGLRKMTAASAALLDALLEEPTPAGATPDPEEQEPEANEFPEGKEKYAAHVRYERNPKLVEQVKQEYLKANDGKLPCSICGFDFEARYGSVGKDFAEVHHVTPLSEYEKLGKISTDVGDLVVVCSNCHRMLHRKRPWLTIQELEKLME